MANFDPSHIEPTAEEEAIINAGIAADPDAHEGDEGWSEPLTVEQAHPELAEQLKVARGEQMGSNFALMTTKTTTALRRRPRGIHPKRADVQQSPGGKGSTLPEYLEAYEAQAILTAAPHSRARLLFLLQCRAGLRVSEGPGPESRRPVPQIELVSVILRISAVHLVRV